MTTYDEIDGYDIPEHFFNERHWKNGYHYDKFDNKHKINKMSDSHLLSTINYFKESDTSPLVIEVKKRNLI